MISNYLITKECVFVLQNLLASLIDSFYLKFIARSFVIAAPYDLILISIGKFWNSFVSVS